MTMHHSRSRVRPILFLITYQHLFSQFYTSIFQSSTTMSIGSFWSQTKKHQSSFLNKAIIFKQPMGKPSSIMAFVWHLKLNKVLTVWIRWSWISVLFCLPHVEWLFFVTVLVKKEPSSCQFHQWACQTMHYIWAWLSAEPMGQFHFRPS